MVSESEFDKNQAAYKAMQQMQTAGPSPTTAGTPTEGGIVGAIQQAKASVGLPVNPLNVPPGTASMAMQSAPIGAVGGSAGIGSEITKILSYKIAGSLTVGRLGAILGVFAAAKGPIQTIYGQEFNKFLGIFGVKTNQLNVAERRRLATTLMFNPETGQLEFIDPDMKFLKDGLKASGIPESSADYQAAINEITVLRQDKQQIIDFYNTGQVPQGWQGPYERPEDASKRYIEYLNKRQENEWMDMEKAKQEQLAYETTPVNAAGKTQKQIDETNTAFSEGQMQSYQAEQRPRILTGPKRNVAQGKELAKETPAAAPPEPPSGGFSPATGPFTPKFRTKRELEASVGASLTDEAWRRYLLTGSI